MRNKTKKIALIFLVLAFFAWNALNFQVQAAEDAEDLQNKIEKYQNKAEATQNQLDSSQTLLQKNKVQTTVTQSLIQKAETEITRKEEEIKNLNNRMELNRQMLKNYLQEMYFNDQEEPVIQLALNDMNLNNLTDNFDNMVSIKEKVLSIIGEINNNKAELDEAKNNLEEKQNDHEKLLQIQQGQQYEIKQDINQAQATLAELNAKINKLKGELSKFLGSAVSFKNIIDAAGFAAKVTGARKDYLLGVLVVESNLGRFTGGCNFKESKMSGARAETFKSICKELKYDYTKQKVSCPPRGYKGTGGAMGVAQFMPDTWAGYKSSIASVTGHNPPDPWNLTDGVVAMALKLSKVAGVTAHKKSAEAKAYCIYLAGGNWASYCDNKGANYGDLVLYWADNYEKKLQ